MEKINLVELLKDCPQGMELNCATYENVVFDYIDDTNDTFPIKCHIKLPDNKCSICTFTIYGGISLHTHAKCVIFPKGKTTWEGFVPPCKFKDGDIIYVKDKYDQEWCSILSNYTDNKLYTYIDFYINNNILYHNKPNILCEHKDIIEYRLATEKEKEKLFNTIKDDGYKWNAETKTLEKLVEPRFKVGDRVKSKTSQYEYTIAEIRKDDYIMHYATSKYGYPVPFYDEDKFEVIPNKFDINTLIPFESKVLVRDNDVERWRPTVWGFYDNDDELNYPYECVGAAFAQCIPYEGNEHLLGTPNVCDDFYKNWK